MKKKIITSAIVNLFKKFLISLGTVLLVAILLSFNIKGDIGNPLKFQNDLDSRMGGPFESSGTNSRYALVKAIAENHTFILSDELAKFSSPDVTAYKGNYSTLFTPGISFAAVPFYYLGKFLGLPQLVTFLSTTIFAGLNIFLIYLLSRKFNVGVALSLVSGLAFGFATSALAYSNTLTQHHLSATFILLGILNAVSKRNFINNLLFGIICGAAALADLPNVFMMMPVGLYVLAKNFSVTEVSEKLKLNINLTLISILIGVIPLLGLFGWYNKLTLGNPLTIAQNVGRTDLFATDEIKEVNKQSEKRSNPKDFQPLLPFNTRIQIDGLYILLFSNERGIFYYNPIVIFGIFGLLLAIKNKNNQNLATIIISVVMVNILIYSMFGDPWGGWSFGPRYLIPSSALLSIGIGYALSRKLRNPLIIVAFILVLIYSTSVNVLGSTTTNLVPPKVEAIHMPNPMPYTYTYNINLAAANKSGILIYNLVLRNLINVKTYIYIYASVISLLISSLYFWAIIFTKKALTFKTETKRPGFLKFWSKN